MTDATEQLDITGVKIAVIDDAKTIRMMMAHTLRSMGCEVECAEDGRVRAFHEKAGPEGPGLINAGVYLIERAALAALPRGRALSLERDVFPRWLADGLCGVVSAGPCIDIGTPESYARAQQLDWPALVGAREA